MLTGLLKFKSRTIPIVKVGNQLEISYTAGNSIHLIQYTREFLAIMSIKVEMYILYHPVIPFLCILGLKFSLGQGGKHKAVRHCIVLTLFSS